MNCCCLLLCCRWSLVTACCCSMSWTTPTRTINSAFSLSASSSEGSYEAYPHWQPTDTNTMNPGTEPVTNHTADKSSSTPNWREPFTGRDTRVIPDRGKSFRHSWLIQGLRQFIFPSMKPTSPSFYVKQPLYVPKTACQFELQNIGRTAQCSSIVVVPPPYPILNTVIVFVWANQ